MHITYYNILYIYNISVSKNFGGKRNSLFFWGVKLNNGGKLKQIFGEKQIRPLQVINYHSIWFYASRLGAISIIYNRYRCRASGVGIGRQISRFFYFSMKSHIRSDAAVEVRLGKKAIREITLLDRSARGIQSFFRFNYFN